MVKDSLFSIAILQNQTRFASGGLRGGGFKGKPLSSSATEVLRSKSLADYLGRFASPVICEGGVFKGKQSLAPAVPVILLLRPFPSKPGNCRSQITSAASRPR
jgi:hypothetical protein